MKKMIFPLLALVALVGYFVLGAKGEQKHTIGVVVPIEHKAMDEMVRGFREALTADYGEEIKIDVQNAQGDLNLQKSIINNFKRKKYAQIVSIGTDVTLMTMNVIKEQPIIGLDVTDQVKQTQPNITGVLESPIEPSYHFVKELLTPAHKVAMVYSGSDKNYQMVKKFAQLAEKDGIVVQQVMVQSLSDLYVLASRIDKDAEAIFIAKDHLVASGAASLAKTAEKLQIPLITSDEGSVLSGGAVALGNKEVDIGRCGAQVMREVIEGESPADVPIKPVVEFTLFVNPKSVEKQGFDMGPIVKTAERLGYKVERVN